MDLPPRHERCKDLGQNLSSLAPVSTPGLTSRADPSLARPNRPAKQDINSRTTKPDPIWVLNTHLLGHAALLRIPGHRGGCDSIQALADHKRSTRTQEFMPHPKAQSDAWHGARNTLGDAGRTYADARLPPPSDHCRSNPCMRARKHACDSTVASNKATVCASSGSWCRYRDADCPAARAPGPAR